MMRMLVIVLIGLVTLPCLAANQDHFVCSAEVGEIQQLRIYEINRSNKDAFHRRFRDHALRIMKRYEFKVVDAWESDTGEKLEFVYILSWPDKETMELRWKEFLEDKEWIEIKKRTAAESGELVREANGQSLRRLSYSPACTAN
jgi:hypothetical protein